MDITRGVSVMSVRPRKPKQWKCYRGRKHWTNTRLISQILVSASSNSDEEDPPPPSNEMETDTTSLSNVVDTPTPTPSSSGARPPGRLRCFYTGTAENFLSTMYSKWLHWDAITDIRDRLEYTISEKIRDIMWEPQEGDEDKEL